MTPTKALTLKVDVKASIEVAQELLSEFRAIKQRAARAEELLLVLLNDWEVAAK